MSRGCQCGDCALERELDDVLWELLGAELDAASIPPPPRVPRFAAETVRPPPRGRAD